MCGSNFYESDVTYSTKIRTSGIRTSGGPPATTTQMVKYYPDVIALVQLSFCCTSKDM